MTVLCHRRGVVSTDETRPTGPPAAAPRGGSPRSVSASNRKIRSVSASNGRPGIVAASGHASSRRRKAGRRSRRSRRSRRERSVNSQGPSLQRSEEQGGRPLGTHWLPEQPFPSFQAMVRRHRPRVGTFSASICVICAICVLLFRRRDDAWAVRRRDEIHPAVRVAAGACCRRDVPNGSMHSSFHPAPPEAILASIR